MHRHGQPRARKSACLGLSRQLKGVFNVRAAWELEELIERASPTDVVELDFRRVREYQDLGLAVLAQALRHRRQCLVAVRGLRVQQVRILHRFGVSPFARGLQFVADDA
jgi:hypothetical protein